MPELIERKKALKNICKYCSEPKCKENECMVFAGIKDTPTAEPEVRHGRWIFDDKYRPICNQCKSKALRDDNGIVIVSEHCPCCGAKMDGKFTLGSEANGCWISCAECANTGCKNRYVQEAQEDDKR